MFAFLRRSVTRPLTDAIRQAMEKDGATPSVSDPSRLRMVEVGGRYSDREVTCIRVFDPSTAAQQTLDIRRYKDFDIFPGLILRAGHVEKDGTVVLSRPATVLAAPPSVRTRAGRTVADPIPTVAVNEGVTAGTSMSNVPAPAPRA